jgi:hypothetical protein
MPNPVIPCFHVTETKFVADESSLHYSFQVSTETLAQPMSLNKLKTESDRPTTNNSKLKENLLYKN